MARPTLTSNLLIRKAHPALTSNLLIRKACLALTSNHIGTNPIITSERPSTHIHQHGRHIYYHLWNGSALTFDLLVRKTHPSRWEHILPQWWKTLTQDGTHPTIMMKYFHTFTQAGTHPTTMMKDSHPGRNTSYHNDEIFLHLHSPGP